MAVKNPKCLVIDTSVVQAAGGENAVLPEPKLCRDFLNEILKLGHRIMTTNDLLEEWKKHDLVNRAWYVKMSLRGQVEYLPGDTQRADLREAVLRVVETNAIENVRKDMYLVEAAMLADNTVCSRDERIRGHFHRATPHVEELRAIIWVNPTVENEACVIWLREGCPADTHRHLAYVPKNAE